MFDSLRPHGLYCPWDSPGQNTGVGSLSLLQGIFPTQGSNPGLPHCGQILYQLSHKGSPHHLKLCINFARLKKKNQLTKVCDVILKVNICVTAHIHRQTHKHTYKVRNKRLLSGFWNYRWFVSFYVFSKVHVIKNSFNLMKANLHFISSRK